MERKKKAVKAKKAVIEQLAKPTYPGYLSGLRTRQVLAVVSCILAVALIAWLVSLSISGILKFLLSAAVLGLNGTALRYLLALDGEMGLILFRWKEGLRHIERLGEKYGKYWNFLTDIGLVLGFGLSAKLAFKHIDNKTYLIGLLVFLLFVFIILPNSSSITLSLIQIPLESLHSASKLSWLSFVALAVVLLFGVVGFAMFGIIANAGTILFSIAAFLMGDGTALATSSPGVYPVLPYFTIPLVEGLIAMLVLMVVHEGSHGISAIVSKIRLKSTGIITFGFVPVGAFVDIDEKQLEKGRDIDNARVSVAGSTANLFVALLFFIPTAFLMISLPNFQQPDVLVAGVVKNLNYTGENISIGTRILEVNGTPVNSTLQYLTLIDNMKANSTMQLLTDNGETNTTMVLDGIPGFVVSQPLKPEYWFIRPIFATLGLITILNLLVGIINLLPIPSFDGYRLFRIIFKRKLIVDLITGIVVLAFLMNIVPWIWQ